MSKLVKGEKITFGGRERTISEVKAKHIEVVEITEEIEVKMLISKKGL